MPYCVIDLETTTKESYKRKANPFDKDNKIIAMGWKHDGMEIPSTDYSVDGVRNPPISNLYIGFNIKFDLLYLWNEIKDRLDKVCRIWDCQLAEYMLSGQTHLYPSLNECALKYGGTIKDDRIAALWQAGCKTEDIPKDMLLEYLRYDVINTEIVYLAQRKKAEELGMLKLIELEMDGLLSTIEMEYNGMHVDKVVALLNKDQLQHEMNQAKLNILNLLMKYPDGMEQVESDILTVLVNVPTIVFTQQHLNIDSNMHISALLFGGVIKYDEREEIGKYKSGPKVGLPRFKVHQREVRFKSLCSPHKLWKTERDGVYSVDEAVLSTLVRSGSKFVQELCRKLLQRRSLAKELNTYYKAMIELVQPDGCIHHSLNHTATTTGRLSSTRPNMQNIPRDAVGSHDVKKIFTSRYGRDGCIIEVDYSQLEVVAAAFLSQDKSMIADIITGRDTHRENAAVVFNKSTKDVTKEERQIAKIASFQLLYGAGLNKIADVMFDGNKDLAATFINTYYDNYPRLKEWQNETIQRMATNRQSSEYRTQRNYPAGVSKLQSCTGRIYTFIESDAPDFLREKGVMTAFSPTVAKNYPVQGLATADIVPIMLGKLFRVLSKHRDKCLLINTVHDSVLLDCKKDHLTIVCNTVKMILESVPQVFKQEFNIDFNVPVKVEIEVGDSWGTKSKYKPEEKLVHDQKH